MSAACPGEVKVTPMAAMSHHPKIFVFIVDP